MVLLIYQCFRLARIAKVLKERESVLKCFNVFFKNLTPAVERILCMIVIFFVLCHCTSCLWYFIAKLSDFNPDSWVYKHGYVDASIYEVNLSSQNFIQLY
jgi:hypothetical protein